jgi:YHS domain-containing protein
VTHPPAPVEALHCHQQGEPIVVRAFFEILFVLFVVRLVLRFIAPLWRAISTPPPAQRGAAAATDLVFDAVCNTHVPRTMALRATIDGRDAYFCSPECRAKANARLSPVS